MRTSDADSAPAPPPRRPPPGGGEPPTPVGAGAWEYRGRWALVTGASSGIGQEFAKALAARGMNVVLCARRRDRLLDLARSLEAEHAVRADVVDEDLSRDGAPARAWARAAEGRDIHLLVNNAGIGAHGRFDELPLDRQREMVRLNCGAVLELTHLALGDMLPRGSGGIVNVASVVAFQPVPYKAAYAATKAFVLSLSEALAEENRGSGVRILALCPGPTPTEFQEHAGSRVHPGKPGFKHPREVVEAGLRGLERGKTHVAPGLVNTVGTVLGRLVPMRLAARVAGRLG
ncbi:MAG TPA: SDR family oxidoreductase [Longimicrobium sp.]|nr:SDR family oxidoreductase [Longimicrobium sp.]